MVLITKFSVIAVEPWRLYLFPTKVTDKCPRYFPISTAIKEQCKCVTTHKDELDFPQKVLQGSILAMKNPSFLPTIIF